MDRDQKKAASFAMGKFTLSAYRRRHERSAPARAMVQTLEPRCMMTVVAASTPYLAAPVGTGQMIEAENFDKGGPSIAYHVTETVKVAGNTYRPHDAVAVEPGGSNGFDVGYTTVGEWLQYTISVPATGMYTLRASVANTAAGGLFHADVDGAFVDHSIAVPRTGAWQTYQTVQSGEFLLTSGVHKLRILMDQLAVSKTIGNFDWLQVVPAVASVNTLSWHSVAPIPTGMTEGAGDVVNGKLYVFSGYSNTSYYPSNCVYCYDPTANAWTRLANMPVPVTHAGTAVDGNYVYFAGGYPPNSTHQWQLFSTTNVWRFDTISNVWTKMPSLPAARGAGQLALVGTTLHYFGGDDETRASDLHSHWSLDLNNLAGGWQNAAPLPTARNRFGAVVLNGKIYAIGGGVGQDGGETAQTVVEVYDPATDIWTTAASLPTPRTLIMSACTIYNGQIVVAGGETSFNVPTNQVTAYNPVTNAWTQLTPLPAKRIGGILQTLGNALIFTTGHPGFNANTWIGTFG